MSDDPYADLRPYATVGFTWCLKPVADSVCGQTVGHDSPCVPLGRTEEQRRVTS